MKLFEVSSRKSKNGRRKFKLVIHEIYADSCINEELQVGEIFNDNGITWIREYCEKAMPTIKDMSLRVEFADEFNRVEILGHGETGTKDGLPLFENADVVGHFTNAYIDEMTDEDGETKTVLIGEGYLDEMCYPHFVEKLIEDVENDNTPFGSVEILRTEDNNGIVYKYGYKEQGRIPTEYIYSGYALLGVRPADKTAKLLEINEFNKEDNAKMNNEEVKALIGDVVKEVMSVTAELNQAKQDADAQVTIANASVAEKDTQISELNELLEEIKSELEKCKAEKEELNTANEKLQSEVDSLKESVAEAKKKEKVGELNAALASFSDDEKAYAQADIDAFKANPITSEINAVIGKIYEGIGKKSKEQAAVVAEHNAARADMTDIFAEVVDTIAVEDTDIF